jgi:hypothetical protein
MRDTPPVVRIIPETDEEYKSRISSLSAEELAEAKKLELEEREKKIAQRKKEFEEALRIADLTEVDGVTAKERRDRIKSILEEEDNIENDDIIKLRKQAIAKLPQLIIDAKKEIENRRETELEKHARESFHKQKMNGYDFPSQMYRELGGTWERLGLDKKIAPLIKSLCELGIDTLNSCENNVPKGWVWIEFITSMDAERFLDIVAEYDEDRNSLYNRIRQE